MFYPPGLGGGEAIYLIYNWKSTSSPWNSSQHVSLEAIIKKNTGFAMVKLIKDL